MRRVFLSLLLLSLGSAAQASVITFGEVGATNASFTSSDGLILAEWVWSTGLADGHNHISATGGNPDEFEQGHGQEFQGLRFSLVGGGALTLTSFDFRGDWTVGLLNDGSGTAYSSSLTAPWVTQLSGLSSANYIYIYAAGDGGGPNIIGPSGHLDNVVLNAVPEPATLALLGFGLAAGARRYRRRNV